MPGEERHRPQRPDQPAGLPSRVALRRIFITCMILSGLLTYMFAGNLQILIISRYYAEVGIADLWVADESRYYLHMTAINLVIMGVIIFLWVWRRMTGKRFLVMLLFFNLAALAAGYTSMQGQSYVITNEKMKGAAEGLAVAARGFPTANLARYPRSPGKLKRAYSTPESPYAYKGRKRPIRVEIIYSASGPFEDFERKGDEAGTIYYAVNRDGKKFWITYLAYDFAEKMSVLHTDRESGKLVVFTEIE